MYGTPQCRIRADIGLVMGLTMLLALLTGPANAQQYEQIDNYQVHYSAVSTRFISDEIAARYSIQRSQVQGLLNVSVLEKLDDGSTRPVNATIRGSVGPLSGGQTALSFRNVRSDNDTLSHITTFRLHEDEPLRFDLDVTYDRNQEPARVSFIQRFYFN